ncbi:uncharacterized protein B0H64DRAFT_418963 [Chaetomium fimeti]|uniref:Uncharacterized protein n=1 Tax=Chaetomium fimeti TaxID=1854472 RepID=A0AAE0LPV6_9PEZI|nr:hypothetical protein B0H64DRAFT_418963 [Chaetomium fimeti]
MRPFVAALPVFTGILALATAAELPLTPVTTFPAVRPTPATYVSPNPTGTPTSPEKCSQVAARITPQLTPKPTYAPSLKAMADKMGGVERDTCGEMDFKGRFKTSGPGDLNRFQQIRHSTFILPIWAKVSELFNACGEETTSKMTQIAQEPCYRWALDLSKTSNSSGKGKDGFDKPTWRLARPRAGFRTPLSLALSGS